MAVADRQAELLETLRQEQEVLLQDYKLMQSLVDHEGWKKLRGIREQIRGLRQEDFSRRIESMEDAFRSGDVKARIAGLQLALAIPTTMLEDLITDIEMAGNRIQELEDE